MCADDNAHVADALRVKLSREKGVEWTGWARDADEVLELAQQSSVDAVILDLDMPGRDPFDATRELLSLYPDIRVVVFSGHVRRDLIDSAVMAGAWGYVAKSDGVGALMDALRRVAEGDFVFSPDVRAVFEQ